MKAIFFLLFLPVLAHTQTVHRKGDKILYKDEVRVPGKSAGSIYSALAKWVPTLVKKGKGPATTEGNEPFLMASGDFSLRSEYALLRTAHYTLSVTAKEGAYKYRIDSVYVSERQRISNNEKLRSDKDIFKDMGISGPVSEAAEKLLNEIDMNFQKLLAMLKMKVLREELTAK